MKLGFAEILIILVVIGVILLVVRGLPALTRATQPPPPPPPAPRVRRPTAEELEEERIKGGRRRRMRWLGGAFIILGLVALGYTSKIFNVIFMMYAVSGLIILLGIVVFALSARR